MTKSDTYAFLQSLDLKNYQVEPLSNSARHSAPKKCNPEELQRFTFVFPTYVTLLLVFVVGRDTEEMGYGIGMVLL